MNSLFQSKPNNQGTGLFGNQANNQGTGLFGNQGNNQGNTLFGNNQGNNQNTGLFGNQGNNQGTGLFGNNQGNNQNTGLFGNQGNNQQGTGGLFSNLANKPNNIGSGGLFGNNQGNQNNTSNIFTFNNNNTNNINNNTDQSLSPNLFTTITPVIALNQNNYMRNLPLYKLPEEYQRAVLELKTNLKNQEIKLDELQRYSHRIIDLIDQSNKSMEKLGEFNNYINKKLNKYDIILNQIDENFKFLNESFNQEQKNINLMEQDSGYKIDIPSKYLITYSQNLYNKSIEFNQKLTDIITLIKVYYSQNNDSNNFDSGIIESTLAEFIKIVRNLLEGNERQEKMINEMFHMIFEFARNYGENPENVKNNIMQYANENDNI